jgi:hypothetical protein
MSHSQIEKLSTSAQALEMGQGQHKYLDLASTTSLHPHRNPELLHNSTYLSGLPAEILESICDHLQATHLQALRLANKRFSDLAIPHLFRTPYLRPFKENFEWIKAICRNPRIQNTIRKLVYVSEGVYTGCSDFKSWHRSARFANDCASNHEQQQHYEAYYRYRENQQYVFVDKDLLQL